ncbi:low temperature requirement protein A [Demequina sp.]|uniref:low temperature requirement protein A n=1 Tax=Demequina sp. TaxID=2050685 RepID=UPI0025D3111F|nr:low temperature requirement protein A [Demequina sp.]
MTFVELFFDLVFVFAITQVTKVVVEDLTWGGASEALLVFWMIWWAWTQFTWALNPADTTHGMVRSVTLLATAAGFLMAVNVPGAFAETGGWFAATYVLVRVLGLAIYLVAASGAPSQLAAVRAFAMRSSLPIAVALVGGFFDSPVRAWIWLAAVILDVVAAGRSGNNEGWDLRPGHFAERHGLFVIIALGESLIVAGQSVLSTDSSALLLGVALGAVTVTCLMWWLYFGWWQPGMEHQLTIATGSAQSRLARDAYSLLHFVLLAGVIAVAAGIEEMVLHPDEPLPTVVRLALAVGIVLYLGGTDLAWWRATHRILIARTTVGLLLALGIALIETAALGEIGLVVGGLGLLVLLEQFDRLRPGVASENDPVGPATTT